jgi:hypothetical protein
VPAATQKLAQPLVPSIALMGMDDREQDEGDKTDKKRVEEKREIMSQIYCNRTAEL